MTNELLKEINTYLGENCEISSSTSGIYNAIPTSGGLKAEGEKQIFFPTKEEAIDKYYSFMRGYIRGVHEAAPQKGLKLHWHWREVPCIREFDGKYSVYSRVQYFFSRVE